MAEYVAETLPVLSRDLTNTVKVTPINQTGGTMTIELTGPTTYLFTVQSGKSQILAARGSIHTRSTRFAGPIAESLTFVVMGAGD